MFKLRSVIVPLALFVSLGVALGKGDAEPKLHALKGHPNLIKAEKELHAAKASIAKSQEANECVFGVEGGHGQKAKEDIEAARKQVHEAAEWVNGHENECKEHAKKGKK